MKKTRAKSKGGRLSTFEEIVVKDGIPDPPNVFVADDGIVQFTNRDPKSYVLELFLNGSSCPMDFDLFLPAFGSCALVVDYDTSQAECVYAVLDYPVRTKPSQRPFGGGGGKIIVGNGPFE
jgi:hypothetical protein